MAFDLITDSLEDVKTRVVKLNNPSVTISKLLGTVSFSKPAADLMGISGGSLIETYRDVENNQIGFKVVAEKTQYTAEVIGQKAPKGDNPIFKIKIRKFLENFKIDEPKAVMYELCKDDSEDLFFADLNNGKKKYKSKVKPSVTE